MTDSRDIPTVFPEFFGALECVTSHGGRYWTARCPAHDDGRPSLCISAGDRGAIVKCWAGCSFPEICAAAGVEQRSLFYEAAPERKDMAWKWVETYTYKDEVGKTLYYVVREETDGKKRFRQFRHDENGNRVFELNGVRRVPYRLPQVLHSQCVVLVEGEKCANALAGLRWAAASVQNLSILQMREAVRPLAGKAVTVVPDNDKAGVIHALQLCGALVGIAKSVRYVDPSELPYTYPGDDVADLLERNLGKSVEVCLTFRD